MSESVAYGVRATPRPPRALFYATNSPDCTVVRSLVYGVDVTFPHRRRPPPVCTPPHTSGPIRSVLGPNRQRAR